MWTAQLVNWLRSGRLGVRLQGVRCAVTLHALPVAARAVMPPGIYRTALPYRALLVLGSAALLAPIVAETLFSL